jgi:hypothetical protein
VQSCIHTSVLPCNMCQCRRASVQLERYHTAHMPSKPNVEGQKVYNAPVCRAGPIAASVRNGRRDVQILSGGCAKGFERHAALWEVLRNIFICSA